MAAAGLKLRIEGMDCGACALKIENAMRGLPGATDISVSFSQATLSLTLDEDRSSRSAVEARIRSLGFIPRSLDGMAAGPREPEAERAWWATRRAALVAATGGLLLVAYLVGLLAPGLGHWAYTAAALAGLLPIARRAVAGVRSGTPFGIETLMTIATVGALAIGEAEEAAIVVLLFALGELLESVAAGHARAGVRALVGLLPRTARRLRGTALEEVPIAALEVGRSASWCAPATASRPTASSGRARPRSTSCRSRASPYPSPRRLGRWSMPAASTAMASCGS